MDNNLELKSSFAQRQLMELNIEHSDLNALADTMMNVLPGNELLLRGLKTRRLQLRKQIFRLELFLTASTFS
ncbi:MAG: hypothetical protein M3R45_10190 [Pseudomonadota bacterium]|nr:hypothetical protein [Pseudomonadota bacterium]